MHNIGKTIAATALSATMAASLCAPSLAFAYSDPSDIVGGVPVSEYLTETAELSPNLDAPRICIMDADKEVIFARDENAECKIASITKIMTAIVAVEKAPDLVLHASPDAANTPGSTAEILEGDELTMKEALRGLMLPSGNDAAYVIAEGVGRKIWEDAHPDDPNVPDVQELRRIFVDAMNAKAKEIGMAHTLFNNPCGLDDEGYEGDHHSTAHDVALMTLYAQQNEVLADIADDVRADMRVKRGGEEIVIKLENTNTLLTARDDALGMKTGFTDAAGNCFAGTFVGADDRTYATAILGCEGDGTALAETSDAWDWVDSSFRIYAIPYDHPVDYVTKNVSMGSVGHPAWMDKKISVALAEDPVVYQWYWHGTPKTEVVLDVPEGDIHEGDVVGKYVIKTGDTGDVIQEVPIATTQTVEAPGFLEGIGIWWQRLFNRVFGGQIVAEDEIAEPELMLAWSEGKMNPEFADRTQQNQSADGGDAENPEDAAKSNLEAIKDLGIETSVADDWDTYGEEGGNGNQR